MVNTMAYVLLAFLTGLLSGIGAPLGVVAALARSKSCGC